MKDKYIHPVSKIIQGGEHLLGFAKSLLEKARRLRDAAGLDYFQKRIKFDHYDITALSSEYGDEIWIKDTEIITYLLLAGAVYMPFALGIDKDGNYTIKAARFKNVFNKHISDITIDIPSCLCVQTSPKYNKLACYTIKPSLLGSLSAGKIIYGNSWVNTLNQDCENWGVTTDFYEGNTFYFDRGGYHEWIPEVAQNMPGLGSKWYKKDQWVLSPGLTDTYNQLVAHARHSVERDGNGEISRYCTSLWRQLNGNEWRYYYRYKNKDGEWINSGPARGISRTVTSNFDMTRYLYNIINGEWDGNPPSMSNYSINKSNTEPNGRTNDFKMVIADGATLQLAGFSISLSNGTGEEHCMSYDGGPPDDCGGLKSTTQTDYSVSASLIAGSLIVKDGIDYASHTTLTINGNRKREIRNASGIDCRVIDADNKDGLLSLAVIYCLDYNSFNGSTPS
jgi:hypothetical protein